MTIKSEDLFAENPYPAYLQDVANELKANYEFVDEINSGKNGKTYKLRSRTAKHIYCLKTVSPNVVDETERARVYTTLRKEVEILSPLSHRCLPVIYENNLDGKLPYYVCTFHPGTTWEVFRKSGKTLKLEEAVFTIVSLVDTIEYLHSKGRTHCDLHQDNILLSERVFAEGLMIIDFGSGHRDSATAPDTADRGTAAFKNVEGQARFRQKIKRTIASDDFKANDIRAFGRLLALMHQCFFASASHEQSSAYVDFCKLLQEGVLQTWQQVREQFDHVIDPMSFMTKTERLFVMKDGTRQSITLPAADPVRVGHAVLEVINSPVYQRLRTIKQLSFCEWFFPGGTHTRFEHSLGVFGVTRNALQCLTRDANFKARFNQRNVDGALLASLVHDLGHYPYAHVIEHYVSGRFFGNKAVKEATHHFNNTLKLLDSDKDIQQAIDKNWGEGLKYEAVRILEGKVRPLSDILDGAIDCDKLDYLRRDSHHCGVPYGIALDTGGILASFRCSNSDDQLLIDSSGVHAVEGFMVAQDQMLGAVYWHPTIRAVFAMFHRFLDGTIGINAEKLIVLVDKLKRCSSDFEALTEVFIPMLKEQPKAFAKAKDPKRGSQLELEPLVMLHLKANFNDIYRPVATYSNLDSVNPKLNTPFNVFQRIVRPTELTNVTSLPIDWQQVRRLRNCFRAAFREKHVDVGRFDVLVDVPWGKASNRVVQVLAQDGQTVRPIGQVSHLAESIFTNPTAYAAPIRVYVSPALYNKLEHSQLSIRTSAEEKFFDTSKMDDESDIA